MAEGVALRAAHLREREGVSATAQSAAVAFQRRRNQTGQTSKARVLSWRNELKTATAVF